MDFKIEYLVKRLAVVCGFCGLLLAFSGTGDKRPNFLIILTDDQTFRAIGYNNKFVLTPHLDRLAKKGVIFERMYTATPVCVASRAAIFTGLYPQKNGTVALDEKSFVERVSRQKKFKTLAQHLAESGYATYFSGKSHLGDPKEYGFGAGQVSSDHDDRQTFKEAGDFINSSEFGQKPFLLWLAPRQPHVPLKPEQKWLDLYVGTPIPLEGNFLEKPPSESFFNQGLPGEAFYRDSDYTDNYRKLPAGPPRSPEVIREFTKAYYATISHLDQQVGMIIGQLKARGLLENTVIIFFSDNGYFLGNHGLGNKLTMHEESVRVPMFVYSEQMIRKNFRSRELVSSVDIFPTLMELAGVRLDSVLHGHSLVPLLKGYAEPVRSYVVSESVGVGGKTGTGHRMVATKKWKYILSDSNEEALFDLEKDPFEVKNLIGQKHTAPVAGSLRAKLAEWKNLVGDKKTNL